MWLKIFDLSIITNKRHTVTWIYRTTTKITGTNTHCFQNLSVTTKCYNEKGPQMDYFTMINFSPKIEIKESKNLTIKQTFKAIKKFQIAVVAETKQVSTTAEKEVSYRLGSNSESNSFGESGQNALDDVTAKMLLIMKELPNLIPTDEEVLVEVVTPVTKKRKSHKKDAEKEIEMSEMKPLKKARKTLL